ncbi:MAG TPA: biotin transporter BioY [Bacillota bacterium]|nr:biotin transporter BioY [Bacillota bacterium]
MTTREMMYVALFAAIICVLGLLPPIPIPFSPVPITAQTLGVMLVGGLLGARLGAYSLGIFILLVAVGAPVLSGGRGGFSVLTGPSAGYIWSWPIAAFVIGLLTEKVWNKLSLWKSFVINILGGVLLIYAVGISVLAGITDTTFKKAAISALLYIPGDLIKCFIAAYIAVKMKALHPLIKR